jgi:hypothetical protein
MAEKGVLGSIIASNGAAIPECVEKIGGVQSFHLPAHQTIYTVLCDMWEAKKPIDLITFTQEMRERKLLEGLGGAAYITELFTFVPTAANVAYYLDIVSDYHLLREIIALTTDSTLKAYGLHPQNADQSPMDLLDVLESKLASLRSLHSRNGLQPLSWEELSKSPDLADSLLENRFLERGQGLLVVGPAGCGKSTAAFQMCCCWASGLSGLHIAPSRPLRIVVLQTEDSKNDVREYAEGILSQRCFTAEKKELVKQNLIVLPPVPGASSAELQVLLNHVATKHKPDLISLNPLLAFCAADYTRELGAMLYQVIDPVIKKHHVGFLGVHHTTKPIYKDTSGYGAYDYQYLAAGDARIANWPRASMQIEPVATNPTLTACFRITKRWQRLRWVNEHGEPTRERYIKHSAKIWWDDATRDEIESARANENPQEILDILPPASEPGIIREEIRVRAKNKLHIGKGKADDWLKIAMQDGMAERYEKPTTGNRKIALFRRRL